MKKRTECRTNFCFVSSYTAQQYTLLGGPRTGIMTTTLPRGAEGGRGTRGGTVPYNTSRNYEYLFLSVLFSSLRLSHWLIWGTVHQYRTHAWYSSESERTRGYAWNTADASTGCTAVVAMIRYCRNCCVLRMFRIFRAYALSSMCNSKSQVLSTR